MLVEAVFPRLIDIFKLNIAIFYFLAELLSKFKYY